MSGQNDTPLVRFAELDIDPAHLDQYTDLLKIEIEASVRLEPGVLALYAISVRDQPTAIRIMEIYADQDTYESHLKSAHFLEYKQATLSMIQSLRLIAVDPIILGSGGSGQDLTHRS